MSQQEKKTENKKAPRKPRVSRIRRADPFYEREAEKYEFPLPSREYILQILTEAARPMSGDDLIAALDITEAEIDHFARRIHAMEREGQLMRNRAGDYIVPDKADLIRGKVEGHPDGFGFLIPDDGSDDMFLGPRAMREVMHGDKVLVRAMGLDQRGRREAKIVEVLERANTRVVGRVVVEQGVAFVQPENRRIAQQILLSPDASAKPRDGQVVTVEITQPPGAHTQAIGRIVETLGNYADAGMEIEIALRKNDLPFEFSEATLAEAKKLPDTVRKKDWTWNEAKAQREDIRHLPLVTIDGETARDFDDAVFCEKQGKGYRLIVAIADVSHYVTPGSALDADALARGTSVYFPRRVIPMLPEKISNGLCSLNPQVERLCMVCDMAINAQGIIKQYRFYPAVMFSHARLTYNMVAAALYEKEPAVRRDLAAVLPQLDNLDELFRVMLKARAKRGAIDFETVETKMVFDDNGKIDRIVAEPRNDAHRVIEECMLAANVCASEFLLKSQQKALYRIHEGPTAEKLTRLREFLAEFGFSLAGGDKPRAADFAAVVDKIRERPDFQLIQTVMLRSLQQAVYSPDNVGHFGLAYEAYTHFTSPIRRYPDLLVHRAIKAVLSKKQYEPSKGPVELLMDTRRKRSKPNDRKKQGAKTAEPAAKVPEKAKSSGIWEDIGVHCSATERRADEASRDVETWLKCFYMQDRVGEIYSGNITAVTSFGIFVTLDDLFVEGLVHISDLGKDYFHYDEARHELAGERGGERYRLSDRVTVQLVRVDLESRKIDFKLVEGVERATTRTGKTAKDAARKLAVEVPAPVAPAQLPEPVIATPASSARRARKPVPTPQVEIAAPPVQLAKADKQKSDKPKDAKQQEARQKADKPLAEVASERRKDKAPRLAAAPQPKAAQGQRDSRPVAKRTASLQEAPKPAAKAERKSASKVPTVVAAAPRVKKVAALLKPKVVAPPVDVLPPQDSQPSPAAEAPRRRKPVPIPIALDDEVVSWRELAGLPDRKGPPTLDELPGRGRATAAGNLKSHAAKPASKQASRKGGARRG
jgi:ribonuclease R